VGDLGQVLLVEQAHLQGPVIGGQGLDGRGAQRGDPAQSAEFLELFDPGGGDHAAVSDHHHVRQAVPGLEVRGEGLERGRVRGIAGNDGHGHGPAVRVGEQPYSICSTPFFPSRE
jgi:hypothetical protein